MKNNKGFGDEVYPTFVYTITSSSEWKAWKKWNDKRMKKGVYKGCFDIAESEECGWISSEHWKAFTRFIKKKRSGLRATELNHKEGPQNPNRQSED